MKNLIFSLLAILLLASCSQLNVEKAVTDYEEFYSLKAECDKLNEDLCRVKQSDPTDQAYTQFSKAQMLDAKRHLLSRWVNTYNAKSKMITRSLWKSNDLPHSLNVNDFNCYN